MVPALVLYVLKAESALPGFRAWSHEHVRSPYRAALVRVLPPRALELVFASGVLLYAGVGAYALLQGGNFLDYDMLDPHHPQHGQHLGLLLIEFGVGLTVASGMLIIFLSLAGRGEARTVD